MNGRETIFSILNYYNENKIDFDVYIVADAQFKTCKYMSEQIIHADENEFFSRTAYSAKTEHSLRMSGALFR